MIFGAVMAAIAGSLMSTFTPTTSTAAWVCYQLLNGVARGMMSQQSITAIQANLPRTSLPLARPSSSSVRILALRCPSRLGQTTLQNSLLPALAKFAPEVDAERVAGAGATDFGSVVPASSVPGVILAYNEALITTVVSLASLVRQSGTNTVYYLSMGSSPAVFTVAWGMGWTNLKGKKEAETTA
jgi:hypothetical protein